MKLTKKPLSLLLSLAVLCPSASLGIVTANAAETDSLPAAGSPLTVRANSNYAPTFEKSFGAGTDQITVTWWVQASAFEMIDFEGTVTYDTSKLAVDMTPGVNTDQSGADATIFKPFSEGVLCNLHAPQKTSIESLDKLPNENSNDGVIRITAYQESGASLSSGNGGAVPLLSVTFTPVAGASGVTDVNFYAEESLVRSTDGTNTESIFYSEGQRPNNNLQYLPENPVAIKEKAGTGAPFQSITAVGNGEGNWLLGQYWNLQAEENKLKQIADGVWQITYTDVEDGFSRTFGFSADGCGDCQAPLHSSGYLRGEYTFGLPQNAGVSEPESGVWYDACWDGKNIAMDIYDISDVTLTLDLTSFDFSTKTGAKFKVDICENNYLVAGNYYEIFGTYFDNANHSNDMQWDEAAYHATGNDAIVSKTYTVNRAYSDVAVRVVKNEQKQFGDAGGHNVLFDVTQPGSFTVSFDMLRHTISVTGDHVVFRDALACSYISVVGNGEGHWLLGEYWNPQAEENKMKQIADGVWQISYTDVEDGFSRTFGFSVDGRGDCLAPFNTTGYLRGDYTFGLPKNAGVSEPESGVWYDACWDGENIAMDIYDISDVTLTLDLTNFDFSTKAGAKFKVDICENNYLVAGNYYEIFGTYFDNANHDNDMQWDEAAYYATGNDAVVSKTYTVNRAYSDVAVRVVKNEQKQFGDAGGHNVLFDVTQPGSFTVSFDMLRHTVSVTGDHVVFRDALACSSISVVGNGDGNWLLGQYWNPQTEENKMKQIADGIWQISYTDVEDGFSRTFGFSVDGRGDCLAPFNTTGYLRGDYTFGRPKNGAVSDTVSGVWYDACWDGGNISFDTEDTCTVILTLDLRTFDFKSKTGAKYKVDIIENHAIVFGDVNRDGSFSTQDITLLQQYLAEFVTLDGNALANADVTRDGTFNVKDVTKMQRVLAELETF